MPYQDHVVGGMSKLCWCGVGHHAMGKHQQLFVVCMASNIYIYIYITPNLFVNALESGGIYIFKKVKLTIKKKSIYISPQSNVLHYKSQMAKYIYI